MDTKHTKTVSTFRSLIFDVFQEISRIRTLENAASAVQCSAPRPCLLVSLSFAPLVLRDDVDNGLEGLGERSLGLGGRLGGRVDEQSVGQGRDGVEHFERHARLSRGQVGEASGRRNYKWTVRSLE